MSETDRASVAPPAWLCASGAARGASHVYRGMPCQDAAGSGDTPRPFCIAVDGRGSSDLSQHGAHGAVARIQGILALLGPLISSALDKPDSSREERQAPWTRAAHWIAFFLAQEQLRLSEEIGCSTTDLEYTLALVVIGSESTGWLQVGDAAIVVNVGGVLGLVATPSIGEFANTTEFLAYPVQSSSLRSGLLPVRELKAAAVCSDGMAFHFIEQRTSEPAEAFEQVFEAVAHGECSSAELQTLLDAPRWSHSHGDDRCLAVLVRPRHLETRHPEALAHHVPENSP